MEQSRCLTPLAVERIETLASSPALVEAVGEISAQHLQARAQAVRAALDSGSGQGLVRAVKELVQDCATLPDWVGGDPSAVAEAVSVDAAVVLSGLDGHGSGQVSLEDLQRALDGGLLIEAGDPFCWTFGVEVAEVVCASVACVAGLLEAGLLPNGATVEPASAVEVLEGLGRDLDSLAPFIFGGIGRTDEAFHPSLRNCSHEILAAKAALQDVPDGNGRLPLALWGICAWSFAAIARILGGDKLTAAVLWEWGSADPVWVLLLAKGALSLPRELGSAAAAVAVAAPAELAALQDAVRLAVLGLASPEVAFATEAPGGGDVAIGRRAAQLAQHRAGIAAEAARSGVLALLLCQAWPDPHRTSWAAPADSETSLLFWWGESRPDLVARLAGFLVALIQPGLLAHDPPWAGAAAGPEERAALAAAREAASAVLPVVAAHGADLWSALSGAVSGWGGLPPRSFLEACCDLAFAAPAPAAQGCASLVRSCLVATSAAEDPSACLAALCVLVANANLLPEFGADGGLHSALTALPQHLHGSVAAACATWRGPARHDLLLAWLQLLPSAPPESQLAPPQPPASPQAAGDAALAPAGLRGMFGEAPADLRCALDGQLMVDPVRSPYGQAFERSALRAHLQRSGGLCPVTGHPLALEQCPRDAELRRRCLGWVRARRSPARPSQRLAAAAAAASAPPSGASATVGKDSLGFARGL